MSGKSSLKTTSLGLITLSKALSQATSHSGHVSSLSWKIVMGPWFKVSSERAENVYKVLHKYVMVNQKGSHNTKPTMW